MIETIVFYFFAAVTVSARSVVTVRNPVHAALFLVLTFFSSAFLWIAGGRVSRDYPGAGLCRRGHGAVPVRGDDAGYQYRALREGFVRFLPIGIALALDHVRQMIYMVVTGDVSAST